MLVSVSTRPVNILYSEHKISSALKQHLEKEKQKGASAAAGRVWGHRPANRTPSVPCWGLGGSRPARGLAASCELRPAGACSC